jgi:hypothetical protein
LLGLESPSYIKVSARELPSAARNETTVPKNSTPDSVLEKRPHHPLRAFLRGLRGFGVRPTARKLTRPCAEINRRRTDLGLESPSYGKQLPGKSGTEWAKFEHEHEHEKRKNTPVTKAPLVLVLSPPWRTVLVLVLEKRHSPPPFATSFAALRGFA